MKRLIASLLVILLFWLLPVVAFAIQSPIILFLNGMKVTDEPVPLIVNSYAYIELHTFAREMNIDTAWDPTTKQAVLQYGNKRLLLTVGEQKAYVNDQQVQLVAAPFMSGDYIYLPLYFVGEQLGIKSNWDELTQSLMLYQRDRSFANSEETESLGGIVQQPLIPDQLGVITTLSGIQFVGHTISLQLDSRVEPAVFNLPEPDRVVIDLPNSRLGQALIGTNGRQSGEFHVNHSYIENIRYAQHDQSTVRLVIDLRRQGSFDVTFDEQVNRLKIEWIGLSYTVVIDPGHGGKDPGADGASGRHEKYFTMEVAERIYETLADEPNIQPYLTRKQDQFVSLEDRIVMANQLKADALISIHGNTHTSKVSGTETFYWQAASRSLANTVHDAVVKDGTQLRDRGVKREQYRLLTDDTSKGATIQVPAVLIELGYLSNAEEEQLMLSAAFQERVAKAVVKGIKQYFGL